MNQWDYGSQKGDTKGLDLLMMTYMRQILTVDEFNVHHSKNIRSVVEYHDAK